MKIIPLLWNNLNEKASHLLRLDRAVKLVWQSSRRWMLTGILLTLLQGLTPLLLLFLTRQLFDLLTAGLRTQGHTEVYRDAALLIGLCVMLSIIEAALRFLAALVNREQAEEVSDHVTEIVHAKSIELDLAYYENAAYYNTLHRTQQQASSRPLSIVTGLMSGSQNLITLLGLGSLLVFNEPTLLLLLACSVIPGFLIKLYYAEKTFNAARQQTEQERRASYINWLLTSEHHAKEIRLFNSGIYFKDKYASLRKSLRDKTLRLSRQQSLGDLASEIPAIAAVFGTLAYAAWKTLEGAMTIGSLVMYYQAFQRGQSALKAFLGSLSSLYENSLFLADFYTFLELRPVVEEPLHPLDFPSPMNTGITFDNVGFTYPGSSRPVLENISFTIKPGEHIALVGLNGAGKTTLIKLLCRLYEPESGRITVDGVDLRQYGLTGLRRQFSVLFQDYVHYRDSASENIRIGDLSLPENDPAIRRAAERSGAHEVIDELPQKYATQLGAMFEGGAELSIGQWQKIALARTFLSRSQLIILDEPTSSLDVRSEYEIFNRFHQLTKGRTAVIISHRLSTVRMVDRIIVLDRHRIAETGSHDELMRQNGIYARLFTMQAGNYQKQVEREREEGDGDGIA